MQEISTAEMVTTTMEKTVICWPIMGTVLDVMVAARLRQGMDVIGNIILLLLSIRGLPLMGAQLVVAMVITTRERHVILVLENSTSIGQLLQMVALIPALSRQVGLAHGQGILLLVNVLAQKIVEMAREQDLRLVMMETLLQEMAAHPLAQ